MLDETPMQSALFDSPTEFDVDRVPSSRGRLQSYKLFMAIVPPPDVASRLVQARESLVRRFGLSRRQILEAERLHITLLDIADFQADAPVSREWIDLAINAGNSVSCRSFSIEFDSVATFTESDAFVFRCNEESDSAIADLRRKLSPPFRDVRPRPREIRTPHMTMLYDKRHIPQHETDPLRWTAGRFVLILSHRGLHHHQWIHEWPLPG